MGKGSNIDEDSTLTGVKGKKKKKRSISICYFALSALETLSAVGTKPLPNRLTSQPLYGSDKQFWASKN